MDREFLGSHRSVHSVSVGLGLTQFTYRQSNGVSLHPCWGWPWLWFDFGCVFDAI